jgi:hypothetical protein
LVFLLVAAADGGIDRKEILSFGATLQKQRGGQSVVFSRILQITTANFEAFLNEIASSGVSVPEQLLQVGLLLQSGKIPREDALVVARQLCELGTAIASASGGGLFGFGSKISKEEAKVLKFLETLLVSCAMTSGES